MKVIISSVPGDDWCGPYGSLICYAVLPLDRCGDLVPKLEKLAELMSDPELSEVRMLDQRCYWLNADTTKFAACDPQAQEHIENLDGWGVFEIGDVDLDDESRVVSEELRIVRQGASLFYSWCAVSKHDAAMICTVQFTRGDLEAFL